MARRWGLNELKAKRKEFKLVAALRGFRYTTSKPRDPEKWKHLKAFLLRRMPPPKEVLSGEYYKRRLAPLIERPLQGRESISGVNKPSRGNIKHKSPPL